MEPVATLKRKLPSDDVLTAEEFKMRFHGQRVTLIANHKADLQKKLDAQKEKYEQKIAELTQKHEAEIESMRKKHRENQDSQFCVVSKDTRQTIADIEESCERRVAEWKQKLEKSESKYEWSLQVFKNQQKNDELFYKEDYGRRLEAAENAAEERIRHMHDAILEALDDDSVIPLRDLERDGVLHDARWRVSDAFNQAMEEMRTSCQHRIEREVADEKRRSDRFVKLYEAEIATCAQQSKELIEARKKAREQEYAIETLKHEKKILEDRMATKYQPPPPMFYPPQQHIYPPPPHFAGVYYPPPRM
jgi:hypothetical protein